MGLGDHVGFAGLFVTLVTFGLTQKQKTAKVSFALSGIVLLLWVFLAVRFPAVTQKSDSAEKTAPVTLVPHIAAQLVIDSATAKRTDYRLILENGPVTIKDIRIFAKSDQVSSAELLASPRQDISPHEKKDFPGLPIFNDVRPLALEFIVTFDAGNSAHYSRFTFLVVSKSATTQPYSPTGSEEGLGDGQAGIEMQKFTEKFALPVGTIALAFPESNPDSSPNQIDLKAPRRQLLINGLTRKAAIQGIFDSGQKVAEQSFSPKYNGASAVHTVVAVWDDTKQFVWISVDGVPPPTR